jgi:DNA-binding GntR family transcriptional regulator
MSIKENIKKVLEALAKSKRDEMGEAWVSAAQLQKDTGLSPADLNDAVEILVSDGLVKWRRYLGTAPYKFAQATITPRGRLSLQ